MNSWRRRSLSRFASDALVVTSYSTRQETAALSVVRVIAWRWFRKVGVQKKLGVFCVLCG
ncbi:MAG: hypothetical protein H8E28_03755 [Anaerolineae bacterium]|nr:hypothetical protein [Anaerolineae bacterium]MBL6965590.1 hypothetical protein [Anaerolineales bacterium]